MDAEGRGAEHPSLPAARQEHSRRWARDSEISSVSDTRPGHGFADSTCGGQKSSAVDLGRRKKISEMPGTVTNGQEQFNMKW